jgi:hypothetical protein
MRFLVSRDSRSRPRIKKTAPGAGQPLHHFTDFKSRPLRENAHFIGLFSILTASNNNCPKTLLFRETKFFLRFVLESHQFFEI